MALSKDRFEQLIARSTDIVIATAKDGTVAYYNDGAARTLGYGQSEVLGSHVRVLYPSEEEARRVMAAMRSSGHGGPGIAETFQTTLVTKTGERIPVAISATILYDNDAAGSRTEDGTVGFAKDLRDILHKDQLATLGEVAVGLSHEINNPLAVVLNQAELLHQELEQMAGERDCSVEVERIDAIRREVGRIASILERLGEMVRTETYETVDYVGPARMIDLRSEDARRSEDDRRLAGRRILVVDDDGGIRRTLQEVLERAGCKVTAAGDGVEALRELEGGGYDAVVSDVVMPRMDGYELYLAIKERTPDLPVLMMTAFHYDKDHIIKRSRMQGLQGVIFKKPVDPARLREALVDCIEERA